MPPMARPLLGTSKQGLKNVRGAAGAGPTCVGALVALPHQGRQVGAQQLASTLDAHCTGEGMDAGCKTADCVNKRQGAARVHAHWRARADGWSIAGLRVVRPSRAMLSYKHALKRNGERCSPWLQSSPTSTRLPACQHIPPLGAHPQPRHSPGSSPQ